MKKSKGYVKGDPKADARRKEAQTWLDKIKAAYKTEKKWVDDAEKAVVAFSGEERDGVQGKAYDFNILFSNVETMVPAVINSAPVPDIRRRFNDQDPAARVVADIMERAISVQIDDSRLQVELEATAHDAVLAGRGVIRIRFKSDIVGGELSKDDIEDAKDELEGESETDDVGEYDEPQESGIAQAPGTPTTPETLQNERITFEAVSWRDYRHGPAARWEDRPWEAFRFSIPKEDEGDIFDADMIKAQTLSTEGNNRSDDHTLSGWEIWCKKSKKVKFIDDDGFFLKEVDDPLGLSMFFPTPRALQPIELTGRLMPVNPFAIYRQLAEELDLITKRIDKLVDAMKVRGWYAGIATDLENVMFLNDNEFAPIANSELWAQNGGIEKAVAFWPIERFIQALRELYTARTETKQAIYEITGISDIVRGASNASETATAQSIKSQWGSLRIQKLQRQIERVARDLFVMMTEILSSKFTRQTLQEMTGIPIIPEPSDPPEVMEQKMAVEALLQKKLSQFYRIDVETDSTIRADLTRQKQEVAEFLQGAAAYFQATAPLVQQGALPAEAAVDIFASTARMFNLGKSVEDTLEKMVTDAKKKAQEPQQPNPEHQAAQVKAQTDQATAQASMQAMQLDAQIKQQQAQINAQAAQQDLANKQAEFELRMQLEAKKAESEGPKAQTEAVLAQLAIALKQIELEIKQTDLALKQKELSAPSKDIAA